MLQGQRAIVTGAAEGVGRHIALRLAREGARLALADVQPAEATADLVKKAGGTAAYIPCDIADEQSIRSCVDTAAALLGGRVDILVNNAGINGQVQLVQGMTLPSWERTLRVNLTGTMMVTREVAPLMIRQGGGRIVNVASNVAKRGLPYRADYVASKWALLGLTQTLALELVSHRIRVNAVCPGPVEGQRIEQVMQSHADAEGRTLAEIRQAWENDAPMKRFISPDEVAAVVCFLASGESSAMTGQALNVTGGLLTN
jgi:NAD(P)-dependent dehydrogenase (short-subunit alcohol dehydrogenase family)